MANPGGVSVEGAGNAGADPRLQDPNYGRSGHLLRADLGQFGSVPYKNEDKLKPKDKSNDGFIRAMADLYQVSPEAVKAALTAKTPDAGKLQRMQKAWTQGQIVGLPAKLDLEGAAKAASAPPAPAAPVPSGVKKDDKPLDVKPPIEGNPADAAPSDPKQMLEQATSKFAEAKASLPADLVKKYDLAKLYDAVKTGGATAYGAFTSACIRATQEANGAAPKDKPAAAPAAPPPAAPAPKEAKLPPRTGNADHIQVDGLVSTSEPVGGNAVVVTMEGMGQLDAAGKEQRFSQLVASLYGIAEKDVAAYVAGNQVLARAHDKWMGARDGNSNFRLTFPLSLNSASAPAEAGPAKPGESGPAGYPSLPPQLADRDSRTKLSEVERQRLTAPQLAALGVPTKDGDFLTTRAYVYGVQQLTGVKVPDGVWGPDTQAAVEQYLKDHNHDTSAFKPACDKALVQAKAQNEKLQAAINDAIQKRLQAGDADHSTWWGAKGATSNDAQAKEAFAKDVRARITERLQHPKAGESWQSITKDVLDGNDPVIKDKYQKRTTEKESTTELNAGIDKLVTTSHNGVPWKAGYSEAQYRSDLQAEAARIAKEGGSAKDLEAYAARKLDENMPPVHVEAQGGYGLSNNNLVATYQGGVLKITNSVTGEISEKKLVMKDGTVPTRVIITSVSGSKTDGIKFEMFGPTKPGEVPAPGPKPTPLNAPDPSPPPRAAPKQPRQRMFDPGKI